MTGHPVDERDPIALKPPVSVGVVADTHGLVRPELINGLRGVDLILHAGDVGKVEVLAALNSIAPVYAVRGNVDRESWAESLPQSLTIPIGGLRFLVLHDAHSIDGDPERAGVHIVVSGHSHIPSIVKRGRILYVNPGSAGPRRFRLPVSMARIVVRADGPEADLIHLLEDAP